MAETIVKIGAIAASFCEQDPDSVRSIYIFFLYAVSCTQMDKQREPSAKTLCSPFSAEYWRHCLLSCGIQSILPQDQARK